MKKNNKILIIGLASVLLLICVIIALLYFATDIFKSDKKQFYKYISKMNLKEFVTSKEHTNYINKLKSEKYSSEGNAYIQIEAEEQEIKSSVEYSTQVDPVNNLASAEINIIEGDEQYLKFNYLRNGDLYGLQLADFYKQYIVFENNNLKEFAKKMGITDTSNIPDKIELQDAYNQETIETLKKVYDKYMDTVTKIAIEQIPNENYSKVKKENIIVGEKTVQANGYQVTIDLKTLQKILVSCIDNLKNDEQVFNLLILLLGENSQEISFEDYQTALENAKQEISTDIAENFNAINLVVYKEGKNVVKLYVTINMDKEKENYIEISFEEKHIEIAIIENSAYYNDQINITIDKSANTKENEEYIVKYELKEDNEQIGNINAKLSRNGSSEMGTVQNSLVINMDVNMDSEKIKVAFDYDDKTTFGLNTEIEKYDESNNIVLNKYTKQQIINLGNGISKKIQEKEIPKNGMIGMFITLNTGLINKANDTVSETKKQTIYEAIALAKADILADYYSDRNITDITEQMIKQKVEQYIENTSVNVTKSSGEQKYIITVDGLELDKTKATLDLSSIYN